MQRVAETSVWQDRTAMEFRAMLPRFCAWLEDCGALVEESKGEWEVIRYRAASLRVGDTKAKVRSNIVYRSKIGALTFSGDSGYHWNLFRTNQRMIAQPENIQPAKKVKSWTQRTREALLERDGGICFYCGLTMMGHDHNGRPTATGKDDITIEHVLAQRVGRETGADVNHLDNLRLAHAKCNRDIGHQPVNEKMIYRDILTDGRVTSVDHWNDKKSED